MYKLTAHSLTRGDYFRPESMGLNWEERMSTATVQLPISGGVSLAAGDWVQDDTEPGKGIVWRVRTVDRQYDRNTVTVTLEHAIQMLKDRIMFGDVTPAMMSGNLGATTCTAQQAIQYILNQQSDWTLDTSTFAYGSVSNPYKFNSDDLFAALETVSSSLEDCIWEYDFSVYPFKLHVKQLSADVVSEMRMSRNITTMRYTMDRNGMYTRFYPIGRNNLKIDGGYVSKNESTWGIVSKVETDQSKTTKAELTAWANERLARHAEPLVTVTIAGLELAEATGETLDRFVIGKKCRVPLPEFGTTVTERVTKLSYRDKVNQKEVVNITLANKLADVATILREQAAGGGRGGRTAAKDAEEDHAWIVDTTDKVELVAEAVAGKDSSGHANWSRVSTLTVDGNGIDSRVTVAEGKIVTDESRITQTENGVSSLVTKTGVNSLGQDETLYSLQTQTASGVSTLVTKTGINSLGQNETLYSLQSQTASEVSTVVSKTGINSLGQSETLYSKITQNADKISLVVTSSGGQNKVNAASIVLGINRQDKTSSSYVDISANYINLTGYVTATELNATDAKITNLTSGATVASTLKTHLLDSDTGFNYQSSAVSWKHITVRYCTLSSEGYFLVSNASGDTNPYGTKTGRIVTAYDNDTIYYLGKNPPSS